MRIISIVATKGGVGKTTTAANLGALLADIGLRTLVIDLDPQPSLSSYYALAYEARGGIYELISSSDTRRESIISKTIIDNLDLVASNDYNGQLTQLLLNSPDGRFRLSALLQQLDEYDVVLIDTQGARSILLESAILASDHVLSPITPELLSAREFVRGVMGMWDSLEELSRFTHLTVPRVSLLINRLDETRDARDTVAALRNMYDGTGQRVTVLDSVLRHLASFRRATALGQPIHRYEPVKPYRDRVAPAGGDQIKAVARELNPEWASLIDAMKTPSSDLREQEGARHVH